MNLYNLLFPEEFFDTFDWLIAAWINFFSVPFSIVCTYRSNTTECCLCWWWIGNWLLWNSENLRWIYCFRLRFYAVSDVLLEIAALCFSLWNFFSGEHKSWKRQQERTAFQTLLFALFIVLNRNEINSLQLRDFIGINKKNSRRNIDASRLTDKQNKTPEHFFFQ